MPKLYPQYQIGAEWRVERTEFGGSFNFVIIGQGSKPGYKKCLVKFDKEAPPRHVNFEAEYSHTHLKKFAKYLSSKVNSKIECPVVKRWETSRA